MSTNHSELSPITSTTTVHIGETPYAHHTITAPIITASTYPFGSMAEVIDRIEKRAERDEYGRYGNATIRAAEAKLAALESTPTVQATAVLFASGMGAITSALFALLSAGDHLVITDDCYTRTYQFVVEILPRFGITHTIVPAFDYDAIEGAIRPETRLLFSESPTNPRLRVLDMPRFASIARAHGITSMVDATFATPYNIRPLAHGIDIVAHSATKYLGGHNDLIAGAVVGHPDIIEPLRETRGLIGCISDSHTAYLLIRGIKTLALRMERHNTNGLAVARFLQEHPRVTHVYYPGLPDHPDHAVATQQMRGWGGVVSFEVQGDLEEATAVIDHLRMPAIAASLGGVESLVEQPAIFSFYDLTPAERLTFGIRGSCIRYACGIEESDDLIADLDQALSVIA